MIYLEIKIKRQSCSTNSVLLVLHKFEWQRDRKVKKEKGDRKRGRER